MRAVLLMFAALAVAAVVRADGPPKAEAAYQKAYVPKESEYSYDKPSYKYQPSYNKPDDYQPGYKKPSYGYRPSYDKSYDYKPSYKRSSYGYKRSYNKPSYKDQPSYQTPSYDQPYNEPDYTQYGYKEPQTIKLFATVVNDFGAASDSLGATGGIVRSLSLVEGGPEVGRLWQTGIKIDNDVLPGEGLYNYQGTISLYETPEFPEGKLFFVGDGSGFGSTTPTYLQKSIVGGTEAYTFARGFIVRIPPGGPDTPTPQAGPYFITVYY